MAAVEKFLEQEVHKVALSEVNVDPSYQRDHSPDSKHGMRAAAMAEGWDTNLCQIGDLTPSTLNGFEYDAVDCGTRVTAMKLKGITHALFRILPKMSEAKTAAVFISTQENRSDLTPVEMLVANLSDSDSREIKSVLSELGFEQKVKDVHGNWRYSYPRLSGGVKAWKAIYAKGKVSLLKRSLLLARQWNGGDESTKKINGVLLMTCALFVLAKVDEAWLRRTFKTHPFLDVQNKLRIDNGRMKTGAQPPWLAYTLAKLGKKGLQYTTPMFTLEYDKLRRKDPEGRICHS